jgi:hypothetical protein
MESYLLKYEFELKQRDIVELMRFLPARKIVFGILMIGIIPLIIIIRHTPSHSVTLGEDYNIIEVVMTILTLIIAEFMAYIGYKLMPKISGKSIYRKIF